MKTTIELTPSDLSIAVQDYLTKHSKADINNSEWTYRSAGGPDLPFNQTVLILTETIPPHAEE